MSVYRPLLNLLSFYRGQFTQSSTEPARLVAEASDLNLAPGHFPSVLLLQTDDSTQEPQSFFKQTWDASGVHYSSEDDTQQLTIFND